MKKKKKKLKNFFQNLDSKTLVLLLTSLANLVNTILTILYK
ncbi:hypothetical protein [uncultured Clostridium sp.]|nr:hypothetical protein [uncultured Clostridium sp.]